MSNTAYDITERLLNALDKNYNVVDMGAISEVISDLENINITKELLETTRLGKHVNELRRRTADPTLARRAKMLVKRWRDLVIPDRSGAKSQSSSSSQPPQQQQMASGSVDNTPHHSPLGSRGFSPAVTPRLSSPQVFPQSLSASQRQGSLTPSSTGVKTSSQIQQHQRRQPLTSPGHRNVPQVSRNSTVPFSPGLKALSSPLVSPVVSGYTKNTSPGLIKNLSPGLQHKFSPNLNRNISPGSSSRNFPVSANKHSPSGVVSRNSSPGVVNSNRNISPGVSAHKNVSPGARNSLVGQPSNRINAAVKNLSPALRLPAESVVRSSSSSKRPEHYDSDSQDVILVDDDDDVYKPVPPNPLTFCDRSNESSKCSSASGKRQRSPVNGEQWRGKGEHSHREAKKARKEPRGRKPKKRRNHKSENRTVDHSLDPVPPPFLPSISSSSTSPTIKNGISVTIPSPISSVPVLVDDIDSRSPKPEVSVVKPRSSRKNGCNKNALDMDEYSAFIKNKIPAPGKKVKTTKELLEEIQARKSGSVANLEEKFSKPKEDFLTAYDNKKKETSVITDIIELNDSNSSLKQEDSSVSKRTDVVTDTKEKEKENEPVKFEPVETILSRLPPIDRSWMYADEDVLTPSCTCTLIYTTPDVEVKMPSPLHQPKKSIFEMDYDETPRDVVVKDEPISSVVVPALPLYEEKLDPYCEAASVHESKPSDVTDTQVLALHNCFIPDVNGTTCDKKLQFGSKKKPICKMDYWGSKPYYDCQSEQFHNVVPKYNYLDYSLDRCAKNLTKIHFDKYEPVEATPTTKQWVEEMEKITSAEFVANVEEKTEDFNSPADSPFSENDRYDRNETVNDHIVESVNLDRDLAISNSAAFDDNSLSRSSAPMNNNDPSFDDKLANDEYQMECDDVESDGSESCKPWMDQTDVIDGSAQDQIVTSNKDNCSSSNINKCETKTNQKRQLNYGDSVMSLPLNLTALNAAVGYTTPNQSESVCNLSCVFRTNYDQDADDALTYSVVADSQRLQHFDDLKREGVAERLKRSGSIDQTSIDQDEDAVSDVDIKTKITDNINFINNNNVDNDNIGALNPELDLCISNGCPEWLVKLSRDEGFREWHEPVVRTSYNEEPLTVLPYIVID